MLVRGKWHKEAKGVEVGHGETKEGMEKRVPACWGVEEFRQDRLACFQGGIVLRYL